MTIPQLLKLLFEHIEANEINSFEVTANNVIIDERHIIDFNGREQEQYNEIFNF